MLLIISTKACAMARHQPNSEIILATTETHGYYADMVRKLGLQLTRLSVRILPVAACENSLCPQRVCHTNPSTPLCVLSIYGFHSQCVDCLAKPS